MAEPLTVRQVGILSSLDDNAGELAFAGEDQPDIDALAGLGLVDVYARLGRRGQVPEWIAVYLTPAGARALAEFREAAAGAPVS